MLQTIPKRKLDRVGSNVWAAVKLIEDEFGGQLTHDSGHTKKTAPTWIFTFFKHQNAQLALRMNKDKLSLYLREKSLDGRDMSLLVGSLASIDKRYTSRDKGVSASLLSDGAPFLNPSATNPLLRVSADVGSLSKLLTLYLRVAEVPVISTEVATSGPDSKQDDTDRSGTRRQVTSANELLEQLNRNAETGMAGEQAVYIDELQRLHRCGCPVPKDYVELKANTDVGCGYDIASTWPGEERYIEVKTTTARGSDFFMTENERRVLCELGEKAWLYRVWISPAGIAEILVKVINPMSWINEAELTPIVWRLREAAITSESRSLESVEQ